MKVLIFLFLFFVLMPEARSTSNSPAHIALCNVLKTLQLIPADLCKFSPIISMEYNPEAVPFESAKITSKEYHQTLLAIAIIKGLL